jgi:hypothetical protein
MTYLFLSGESLLAFAGIDQGTLGIGENKGDENIGMIDYFHERAAVGLVHVNDVSAVEAAGENIGFEDIELFNLFLS